MANFDPIAQMLTIIRNGLQAKKKYVVIDSSNLKKDIARILHEENYITKYSIIEPSDEENKKFEKIKIYLRYVNEESVIRGLEKISKPGKRIYVNTKNIPVVLNHIGIAILSTNKGVLTDRDARKFNVGGEYICKIW
ncbi:MAG TPA: 30S ribosomal protein S8 [Candidatus Cloacimonetes bacterium]|nr:30S ribosomal protein S8 [Candidatus Cloacimonadota bacterium]HEX37889.1 30S ribosomal protein S8 [Candidatus Cloacimonadota bacterium]